MHRAVTRLPAVVGLALGLAAAAGPALASAPLPSVAAQQHSAGLEAPPLPTPSSTSPATDMEGMEGMEGMDHGASTEGESEHTGAHPEESTTTADRPRTAVLSSFAGVNGAVLVTAGVLRRRDRRRQPRRPRRSSTPTAD